MMDVEAVAAGLAAAARVVSGVNAYPQLPLSITEPAFAPVDWEMTTSNGCAETLRVTCAVLVGRVDDENAAAALYAYARLDGDKSLPAALEADPTLGGVCSDLVVTTRRMPRVFTVGQTDYLAAEIVAEIDG
jgi:hypothetical protein